MEFIWRSWGAAIMKISMTTFGTSRRFKMLFSSLSDDDDDLWLFAPFIICCERAAR